MPRTAFLWVVLLTVVRECDPQQSAAGQLRKQGAAVHFAGRWAIIIPG